jgi:diadenosine tetraphosphate (Ap4A) HIT family hydrolase/5-methylcytosine-specific restriction endonuclease McrA
MSYERLRKFITAQMRMSHIYQPVMLMALLKNQGARTARDIAREILKYDESQVDYYEHITRQMPGKVLASHGIVESEKDLYRLKDFPALDERQVNDLIQECQKRLDEYLESRKDAVWKHRMQSLGYISGKLRYEVLKRAQFHCELCGISHEERALEADHVLPRKHGGTDDLSNLQALCWLCNSMKGARDATNLRELKATYDARPKDCIFCGMDKKRIVDENALCFAILDKHPVTKLHTLVITRRHIASWFEMSTSEHKAADDLVLKARERILDADASVEGFNIGVNAGETAGQTIFHLHIHVIPRRRGDMKNPRGGVRHVIPEKGNY